MEEEIWKELEENSNYFISNFGNFKNKKRLMNRAVINALTYIYEDSEANRIKKAKVLGRNLSVTYPAYVLDFLIKIAEKDPDKILDLYEGKVSFEVSFENNERKGIKIQIRKWEIIDLMYLIK